MPKIFPRGKKGIFSVRIYSGGREKWISLRTPHRREAERRAGKLMYAELPPLLQGVIERPKTTLADLWTAYLSSPAARILKASTMAERARQWEIFSAAMPKHADDITQAKAVEYLQAVSDRASPATARKARAQMGGVWREVGYKFPGLHNPWLNLPMIRNKSAPPHTGSFSDAQIDAILKAARAKRETFYELVLVALHTGLRLKDVVHLRHEDASDGKIVLRPSKTERSGKAISVPVHPAIRGFFGPGEGFLWPEEVERYRRSASIHSVTFREMLSDLGISAPDGERLSFHSLRATFISRLERAGVDRRRIQAAVGHVSPAQTGQYSDVALTPEDIDRGTT